MSDLEMLESMRTAEAIEAINKSLNCMEDMLEKQQHSLTKIEVSLKIKHKFRLPKPSPSSTPSSLVSDHTEVNNEVQMPITKKP